MILVKNNSDYRIRFEQAYNNNEIEIKSIDMQYYNKYNENYIRNNIDTHYVFYNTAGITDNLVGTLNTDNNIEGRYIKFVVVSSYSISSIN